MKRYLQLVAYIGVFSTVGITAAVLDHLDRNRRLGEPGLMMQDDRVLSETGAVIGTNTVALPSMVLDYHSESRPITRIELEWLPADTTYARRVYSASDDFQLQVNVVMMGLDRTSIHKPEYCLSGQGWNILSNESVAIPLKSGTPVLPVRKMIAERNQLLPDGSTRMVRAIYLYWFVADGQVTEDHTERMWWMAQELLTTGTLERWAYVSVLGLCFPGQEEQTYARMEEFIAESTPLYHRFDEHTVFSKVP